MSDDRARREGARGGALPPRRARPRPRCVPRPRNRTVVRPPGERAKARDQSPRHFESPLAMAQRIEIPELPEAVITEMANGIEQLSAAELAGVIASVPLAQQTQQMLRAVAY